VVSLAASASASTHSTTCPKHAEHAKTFVDDKRLAHHVPPADGCPSSLEGDPAVIAMTDNVALNRRQHLLPWWRTSLGRVDSPENNDREITMSDSV